MYFDTSMSLKPLRARLEQEGYQCHTPDSAQAPAKQVSAPSLTNRHFNPLKTNNPTIIGYSMGGIIARSYLKESPNRRHLGLTTLATPHHGTQFQAHPLKQASNCAPTAFLKELNQATKLSSQHAERRTALDGVIIPSIVLNQGAKTSGFTPSHPSLLISKRVAEEIELHLNQASPPSSLSQADAQLPALSLEYTANTKEPDSAEHDVKTAAVVSLRLCNSFLFTSFLSFSRPGKFYPPYATTFLSLPTNDSF